MTEDQIKAIAEEYADMYMDEYIPEISKKDNIRNTFIQHARTVLSVLCKKYYIVERWKVGQMINDIKGISFPIQFGPVKQKVQVISTEMIKTDMEDIFGASIFNQN